MRFFSLIFALVFFAGCSLLNVFDGNIPQDNWKIEKIIVGGKEYLSAQSLKAEALKDSQNKSSQDLQQRDSQEQDSQQTDNTDNTDNVSSAQNTLLADSSIDSSDQSSDEAQASDTEQNKPSSSEGEFTSLNEVSTMTFDPSQHRIYGLAACNNYFASYAWKDDDHIEIGNSGITRKLCSPDELMSFEFRFMRDFNGLFTITKNKTSMILDNGKMQIYLQAIKP